jgi:hypothetical protein
VDAIDASGAERDHPPVGELLVFRQVDPEALALLGEAFELGQELADAFAAPVVPSPGDEGRHLPFDVFREGVDLGIGAPY